MCKSCRRKEEGNKQEQESFGGNHDHGGHGKGEDCVGGVCVEEGGFGANGDTAIENNGALDVGGRCTRFKSGSGESAGGGQKDEGERLGNHFGLFGAVDTIRGGRVLERELLNRVLLFTI